jgi:ketosteroid isomerase-like protein
MASATQHKDMKRETEPRVQSTSPDLVDVLATNERFYAAFSECDYVLMESLWSRRDQVGMIPPGWAPLSGRNPVMTIWRRLFDNGNATAVECADAHAYVFNDAAFVTCTEKFTGGELSATNIFIREDGQWKIVHHHAGPRPQEPAGPPAGTVH